MSSPCVGNVPGVRKPGEQQFQTYTGAVIGEFLALRGMPFWAATAVGVAIGGFNMDTFCAGDPPALPSIPPDRYVGYFNPLNPQGAAQLRADMTDLFQHYLWYAACDCSSGTQPPFPAPFPPPPNTASDPANRTVPTATPCGGWAGLGETLVFDSAGNLDFDLAKSQPIPQSAQWMQFQINGGTTAGTSAYPITHTLTFRATPTGDILGRHVYSQNALIDGSAPVVDSFPLPAGAQECHYNIHTDVGHGSTYGFNSAFRVYCGAPPIGVEEPCCPPDPSIVELLNQILRELAELLSRGTGAVGYRHGSVFPGRTGSSSIALTGSVGFQVDVTTGTPTNPQLPGVPPYQWDLGWMSVLTGDGMIEEKRITRQHQVWLPSSAPLATTFGYYLNPGIVATFTQLIPNT